MDFGTRAPVLFDWFMYLFYFNFYLLESEKERDHRGREEGEKNADSMLSRVPGTGLDPRT